MEETFKQSECFLVREDLIRRLPKLVFAACEACRRESGDLQWSRVALSRALRAQCTLCGFVLCGEELLALAEITAANEKSTMLQQLRAGHCAREGCAASHYRLQFYDTPEISWAAVLAECRPSEAPQPQSQPAPKPAPERRIALRRFGQILAAAGIFLLAWMWWQWHTGGRIPYLREPEHFRVTHSNVEDSAH
jgi:hypothetical protein